MDDGAVQISNRSTTTSATLSLDGYIGDGDTCGATLSCYYHASLVQRILLPVSPGGKQPGTVRIAYGALWKNIFSGAADADYQAEYVYASSGSGVPLYCTTGSNSYKTTEHNPGAAASSGDGDGAMWETHQGGSPGKNCDNGTIPSGTPTQVESDNAGSYNPDGSLFARADLEKLVAHKLVEYHELMDLGHHDLKFTMGDETNLENFVLAQLNANSTMRQQQAPYAAMHGKPMPALDFTPCLTKPHPYSWDGSDHSHWADACPAIYSLPSSRGTN